MATLLTSSHGVGEPLFLAALGVEDTDHPFLENQADLALEGIPFTN
jgi:hypothetical protein